MSEEYYWEIGRKMDRAEPERVREIRNYFTKRQFKNSDIFIDHFDENALKRHNWSAITEPDSIDAFANLQQLDTWFRERSIIMLELYGSIFFDTTRSACTSADSKTIERFCRPPYYDMEIVITNPGPPEFMIHLCYNDISSIAGPIELLEAVGGADLDHLHKEYNQFLKMVHQRFPHRYRDLDRNW